MYHIQARIKPYIQPFERVLAVQELFALAEIPAGANQLEPTLDNTHFLIQSSKTANELANRLAYWELIEHDGISTVSTQTLRECTVNLVRNGIALDVLKAKLPFTHSDQPPLPNRRCLRYGPHGIHEYRGKFFPQLVRSLINISGIPEGSIIADPMSGSGTTAVETVLANCVAKGIDMNPLSVALGKTKCQLLSADAATLAEGYEQIREKLMLPQSRNAQNLNYFQSLSSADQKYLRNWFSEDVLYGLDEIIRSISLAKDETIRALARVAFSNIIRRVSWQKNEDLRVRKEIRLDVEIDPQKEFLEEFGRSIRAVLSLLYQTGPLATNRFEIIAGDARECGAIWGEESVDLVITSPPYATALPYLDTDRLSLYYLGLLSRNEHRIRDQHMIGNREVTEKLRRTLWEEYLTRQMELPESIRSLIETIDTLNTGTEVGFRRRNLPTLLAKYFFDMKAVLNGVKYALKPGGLAFVVVGNNHTTAGGKRVDIQTASLLQDIAKTVGLEVEESIPMEMLASRDIFRKNAMGSEEILKFRKPNQK